jgi:thioesterase domain-containing protein
MPTADELERYLHAHVPLSRHMGLRVHAATPDRVEIALPLAPNVNPHGTIFGGALAASCLVGGWMILFAAFARARIPAQIVGKEARCEFLAPATGDCRVVTACEPAVLDALLGRFGEHGRARQELLTVVRLGEIEVARVQGLYTAMRHAAAPAAASPAPSSPDPHARKSAA